MGFSTNYDDVQEFDLIPAGQYEVIIKNIEEAILFVKRGLI